MLGITVSATTNRVTTTGYAFDAAGNTTQEPAPNGYGYTYDAENHLTQVTGTASGTWTYVYDGNRTAAVNFPIVDSAYGSHQLSSSLIGT